jgi:hypothetical protein
MFSLFTKGITDTKSPALIDFRSLVTMIKDHPEKDKIKSIAKLRASKDESYKTLKLQLPNITPNCYVLERNIGDKETFERNFQGMSKYLYFDFDDVDDVDSFKNRLIMQYGAHCSLISKSSSGKGISMLIRVNSGLNELNYIEVWDYIRNGLLCNEDVDMKSRNLGRAWFVPYDTNVFCNYESDVIVPSRFLKSKTVPYYSPKDKSVKKDSKQDKVVQDMLKRVFDSLDIDTSDEDYGDTEVYSKEMVSISDLVWSTPVEVNEPILEYKPVIVDNLYFPAFIRDGKKRSVFCKLIFKILKLNPYKTESFIYSVLSRVNEKYTDVPMADKKLKELVSSIFLKIQKEGNNDTGGKIKNIHFNKNCNLDRKSKIRIANKITGINKSNNSIELINSSIQYLTTNNLKVTKMAIAKHSGLGYATIKRNYNKSKVSIPELISDINNSSLATISNIY